MRGTLADLLESLPQQGVVEWIGVRGQRRAQLTEVQHVFVDPQGGIRGDRYKGRTGSRHVTLVQAEHLPVIASCLGRATVSPLELRRNMVIRGINLLALKNKVICVGEVEMEVTGLCHPCSRMEETFGPGGYNAVRGHGGITARVLTKGSVEVGDKVRYSG